MERALYLTIQGVFTAAQSIRLSILNKHTQSVYLLFWNLYLILAANLTIFAKQTNVCHDNRRKENGLRETKKNCFSNLV